MSVMDRRAPTGTDDDTRDARFLDLGEDRPLRRTVPHHRGRVYATFLRDVGELAQLDLRIALRRSRGHDVEQPHRPNHVLRERQRNVQRARRRG
jgi:hypothetical protein